MYELINGNVTGPLVHIDVGAKDERGLLGIAISGNGNRTIHLFIFTILNA